MTDMDLRRLTAFEELAQLKARYFRALDTRDWPLLASCLTPTTTIDFRRATNDPSTGFMVVGAEEFVAVAQKRLQGAVSVHHGHMPELRLTGPTTATGIWPMMDVFVTTEGSTTTRRTGYGHYYDDYALVDGSWRIVSTRLERLLLEAETRPAVP